jgi:stearoyl-CoA desaturase (delta-9 desaturase)
MADETTIRAPAVLTTAAPRREARLTWAAPGLWAMLTVHAGALLAFLPAARPTSGILAAALGTFVVRNFCVSAGFHRYFSHRAFRTSRAVQFLFALVGGMAVMRSALWWASQHRAHHRFADAEGDPHGAWRGFLWAHCLWFVDAENQATRTELMRDFAAVPELRWLERNELVPILVLVVLCYAFGGFAGWVWAANVSTVALCHVTFALNSVSHRFGPRRYATKDRSTNLLSIALVTFGEGWHNNHHRWPGRARLGEGRREIDLSWWGLAAMERVGLIWNVRR